MSRDEILQDALEVYDSTRESKIFPENYINDLDVWLVSQNVDR